MFVKLMLVGLLACINSINSSAVPFITKCQKDDEKCMKASAQAAIPIFAAGIPELGVQTLDPFFMKSLDASSNNLKLILKDITGTGLSKCIAKKIHYDDVKSKLIVKLECTVDFEGLYEINGNIIVLRIEGAGRAHVVLRKIIITAEANIVKVTGKDGELHWSIKSYKHSYELKEKATVELDNLFNGNEALGRAAKELFASSPNEIVVEVGPPIVKAVVDKIVVNIEKFFKHIALKYLLE